MIYPATAYAWSAISYLAKQIIKLITQTTALLNPFGDANRGLPNSIITHSAAHFSRPSQDANSSHQETSGRASAASSPERGFAHSWLLQLQREVFLWKSRRKQFLLWKVGAMVATHLAGQAAFLCTPFPLKMNLLPFKTRLGKEKCWFYAWLMNWSTSGKKKPTNQPTTTS